MMTKILVALALIFSTSISFAAKREDAISFLTQKMIKDFQTATEIYNTEKAAGLPELVKENDIYVFTIKKSKIHFSIVNYLNQQLYIDDQLSPFPTSENIKTTFINLLMSSAVADEEAKLDSETTKILVQTLASYNSQLEKIGWSCMTENCKREIREKNLANIAQELKKQQTNCKKNQDDTAESIRRLGRTNIHYALSFLGAPEFDEIKKFMEKLVINSKVVTAAFMKDYIGADNKPHATCMEALLVNAPKSDAEKTITAAKENCIALEELKSCLVNFKADTNYINDKKREVDSPIFIFPDVTPVLEKNAVSK